MQKRFRTPLLCALLVLPAFAVTSTFAAEGAPEKDPAQWSTPDATPQARYVTAKKEADAAYQAALVECRGMKSSEKTTCSKEAQGTYASDLSAAKAQLKQ